MQNVYRLSSFLVFSFFFALQAWSQTPCEKIVHIDMDTHDKQRAVLKGKETLSDEDVAYMVGLNDEAIRKMATIVGSQTDGSLIRTYRFCTLDMTGALAVSLMRAGRSGQVIYDLLSPLREMVFALDIDVMNNYNYVTCINADNSAYVISSSDYEKYAVRYYYCFLRSAYNIDKTDEARTAFAHFSRYNYGVEEDAAYGVASTVVNYKIARHTPDADLLYAATYMLDHYMHDYAYDSTQITVGAVVTALNDPLLADTSVSSRASDLFNLYEELETYCRRRSHDDITENTVAGLLYQSMHSTTSTTNIGGLLEVMKFNNHPYIDSIIAMEDPVVLQNVIGMCERYIVRSGKLREPWFWKNLVKLYTKAGNTDAAADAQKKFEKYKKK